MEPAITVRAFSSFRVLFNITVADSFRSRYRKCNVTCAAIGDRSSRIFLIVQSCYVGFLNEVHALREPSTTKGHNEFRILQCSRNLTRWQWYP